MIRWPLTRPPVGGQLSSSAAGPHILSNAPALVARASPPLDRLAAEGGTASRFGTRFARPALGLKAPPQRGEGRFVALVTLPLWTLWKYILIDCET